MHVQTGQEVIVERCVVAPTHPNRNGQVWTKSSIEPDLPTQRAGPRLNASRDYNRGRKFVVYMQQISAGILDCLPTSLINALDHVIHDIGMQMPQPPVDFEVTVV
ncbi:MAG: hypothetical protein E5V51_24620, partial [Mesorhizobium sp.]